MIEVRTSEEEFDDLRQCLAHWPRNVVTGEFSIDCHARLASCLRDLAEGRQPGTSDIASHVASVLRRQMSVSGSADMLVPESPSPWPDDACWTQHGIEATRSSFGYRRLIAKHWQPTWLPGSKSTLPAADLFDSDRHARRQLHRVPADPSFTAVLGSDFDQYVTPGQRQAVRTVLSSRQGSTIIVSLPTGGGKTEVALAEALRGSEPSVTVVVIPTIALAIDQERRLQQVLRRAGRVPAAELRYAYLGEDDPQIRSQLRSRIRSGEQRVVFAAPESVVGSLAAPLFDAASAGLLRLFAIDEAHLVADWGGDFRPEFQVLPGLRSALLRTATEAGHRPFKTLLLSATLPQPTLEMLSRLFGSPGPVEATLAVALRAEPSYWISRCNNDRERCDRLLEALANLPRPAVIYVAKRVDAYHWVDVLRESGYTSVRAFTGETTASERREVLAGLRGPWGPENGRVDIVVATTAFGVGVDQPNIRAIIHACIPESLDRFYQEVGRGGRDGHPSVSLLLWMSQDLAIAESLATGRLITPELGLKRWESLVSASDDLGAGRRRLRLDTHPGHLAYSSLANRKWNTRTLALMTQSALISFDAERPKATEGPIANEQRGTSGDSDVSSVVIRLRRGDVSRLEAWETAVVPARARLLAAKRQGLYEIQQCLKVGASMCEALQAAYTTRTPTGVGVIPILSCGGCPGCRPRTPIIGVPAEPPAVYQPETALSPDLNRLFAGANRLLVTTEEREQGSVSAQQQREQFVRSCLRHGVEVVVARGEDIDHLKLLFALNFTRRGVLFAQSHVPRLSLIPNLPMLLIADETQQSLLLDFLTDQNPDAKRIVLANADGPDPANTATTLGKRYHPQYAMDTFMALL